MTTATVKASARDRLLDAADELFYREGVQSVGIDRIIEHAGVAKASLYNCFGSKEELIRAYLQRRHASNLARITAALGSAGTPRKRLGAFFDAQDELLHRPTYRGCAFVAASAEATPGSAITEVSEEYRGAVRDILAGIGRDAGLADPEGFGRTMVILYDGAGLAARMDRDLSGAVAAKAAALAVFDSAPRVSPLTASGAGVVAPSTAGVSSTGSA
jgi:AcrR family transcriptional regulator